MLGKKASLPSVVNWVTAGKVTPILDQGNCGGCCRACQGQHNVHLAPFAKGPVGDGQLGCALLACAPHVRSYMCILCISCIHPLPSCVETFCTLSQGHPISTLLFPLPQSHAESCWAHAATTVIESTYLILYGGNASTLALSRQQLLACTNEDNSPFFGLNCAGGSVDQVQGGMGGRDVRTLPSARAAETA